MNKASKIKERSNKRYMVAMQVFEVELCGLDPAISIGSDLRALNSTQKCSMVQPFCFLSDDGGSFVQNSN